MEQRLQMPGGVQPHHNLSILLAYATLVHIAVAAVLGLQIHMEFLVYAPPAYEVTIAVLDSSHYEHV